MTATEIPEEDPTALSNRLKAVLNAISDPVLTANHDGTIRKVNVAFTRHFGFEVDDLEGRHWSDVFATGGGAHPDLVNALSEDGGRRFFSEIREINLRRVDGQVSPYEIKIDRVPGFDELGFVAVLRDVSDRRERQQLVNERRKLAESETRFRDFAECGADWFWEIDADLRFTYMSAQVERATGYPPEWHIGHTREELGLDEQNQELMDALYPITDRVEAFDEKIQVRQRKDGGHVWIAFSGKPIVDDDGNFAGYRGVSRDVTEAIEREKALQASNAELENFAYAASHDLQEPLRKIMAFGYRLTEEIGDGLDELPAMYLDRMTAASERMSKLITDLLEFSRAGRSRKKPASVDLNKVVAQVLADQELNIRRLEATVDCDPLPVVCAEEAHLYQIFANLIGNALKFVSPDRQPEIRITCKTTRGLITLAVADNGVGFDNEHATRIFELFGRLHGRTEFEGNGLGLAICKKNIETLGGRIKANGVPGEGATFTLRLPAGLLVDNGDDDERAA